MRTTVTNTSGGKKFFGWLPPHGKELEDGQSVTLEGDLKTVLASGTGRFTRKKEIEALNADIEAGAVAVEAAPEPSSSSSEA